MIHLYIILDDILVSPVFITSTKGMSLYLFRVFVTIHLFHFRPISYIVLQ